MNKNSQIIRSNLSTLLKRFSKTDVIEKIDDGRQIANVVNLKTEYIRDNRYFINIDLDDKTLDNLEKDIMRRGIVSPLLVRQIGNQEYEIISGRKRLYCAKKLKIQNLSCVVQNFSDEEMLLYILFSSNNVKNKSVINMANVCNILCKEFNYTQSTLADILDMSRPHITNLIRILKLPRKIQRDVAKGKLSYGHAKILIGLDKDKINEIVSLIYEKSLSVRDVEYLVNEMKNHQGYDDLINNFQKRNNVRVKITGRQLILSFKNKRDLKRFIVKK